MSHEADSFEDVPDDRQGGIPWYAATGVVVVLGLVASIVDWVLGVGIGVATGVGFLIGCVVLGGRVRMAHILSGFLAAPICFAVIVTVTATVQLFDEQRFGTAFGVFWTYGLVSGAPYLFAGTIVACLLSALRLSRRRR